MLTNEVVQNIQPLVTQLKETAIVSSIESLLCWDQETHMPDML